MLTSHSRTHQSNRSPFVKRFALPKPTLLSKLIKCGHCGSLFKTPKDLTGHICIGKTPADGPSTSAQANSHRRYLNIPTKSKAARRRLPPRKPTVQEKPEEEEESQPFIELSSSPPEDETQLIVILNQSTNELMEITAPRNMKIQDVLNSLNLSQLDGHGNEVIQPDPDSEEANVACEVIQDDLNSAPNVHHIYARNKNDQPSTSVVPSDDSQTDKPSEVVHEQSSADMNSVQSAIDQETVADFNPQEQQIVLPAECFNEDGSLILDEAMMARFNIRIGPDGTLTTDSGSFILEQGQQNVSENV